MLASPHTSACVYCIHKDDIAAIGGPPLYNDVTLVTPNTHIRQGATPYHFLLAVAVDAQTFLDCSTSPLYDRK